MEKKLYKVKFINQISGEEVVNYFLAFSAEGVEEEVADIVSIEPLTPFEDLTIDPPLSFNS